MTRITDFFTTFTKIKFGRRALRHRGWTEAGPVLSKNEPFRWKIIKIIPMFTIRVSRDDSG